MRALLQSSKVRNKRAISAMIAYVLLIAITIAISGFVYNWLRFYVSESDVPECPTGVNVIIKNYECVPDSRIVVTLKNKGTFSVDGFILRVHDRPSAEFGFYTFDEIGAPIEPGQEFSMRYNFSDYKPVISNVTLIEVQPYRMDGDKISCKSIAKQRVTDC